MFILQIKGDIENVDLLSRLHAKGSFIFLTELTEKGVARSKVIDGVERYDKMNSSVPQFFIDLHI